MDEIKVFVAMLLPFHDGSGLASVLGVYSNREKAESSCYRAMRNLGYLQSSGCRSLPSQHRLVPEPRLQHPERGMPDPARTPCG